MIRIAPLLLTLAAAGPLGAQICFRDRPHPGCSMTLVTEFGALMAFENELRRTPGVHTAYWELGLMRNIRGGSRALGGTVYLSYDDTDLRHVLVGLKARARTQLTPLVTLTGSVGVLFAGDFGASPDAPRATLPGLTGRVDLSLQEWVGVSVGLEAYGVDPGIAGESPDAVRRLRDERVTGYLGMKAGGLVGAVLGPVVVGLIHYGNKISS
jgi:hypothetical protein